MGRASRWFRGLLGLKKPDSSSPSPVQPPPPSHCREKRRWSFVKSHRDRDGQSHRSSCREPETVGVDREGHAMAVAASTAAVAEAAVAAAQAAAAVVRLTSSGKCSPPCVGGADGREEWAALKIQSAFRGYLARRALRALKGLVKIQALVRGHIERKKTAIEVQQMQTVLRVQARARAQISESSQSSSKSSHFNHPGPKTPEKSEQSSLAKCSKQDHSPILRRNGSKSCGRTISYQHGAHFGRNKSERRTGEGQWDLQRGSLARNYPPEEEEHGDKILEADTIRPLYTPKRKNHVPSLAAHYQMEPNPSPSSGELQSLRPLKFTQEMGETPFCTADNSPQFHSASSRGGSQRSPFTASDGPGSFFSRHSNHPNYMAYTESSRAKVRSLSAPKQRPQFEKPGSNGFGDSRPASQVPSSLRSSFASKAYPGSGRLDRLGMPIVRCGAGSGYRYYN